MGTTTGVRTKSKTYPYGERFQDEVLALCLRERGFLGRYAQFVKPEFFDDRCARELVRLATDYYFERSKAPTRTRLETLVSEAFPTDSKMENRLLRVLDEVYDAKLDDADQIAEVVAQFGETRKIEATVLQAIDMIRSGEKTATMWELFDRARIETAPSMNEEMDLSAHFMDAPRLVSRSGLYNSKLKIPTMIPGLDECLNGGLGRGEVGIIVADTGRGKSSCLVNFGAAAALHGVTVLHLLVTELVTIDMLLRYSARFTGIDCQDIANEVNVAKFEAAMDLVRKNFNPQVKAQRIPPLTTVSQVRSIVSRYAFKYGKPPGLLLVDNTDDLVSGSGAIGAYDELGFVYSALKDLGHDYDMPIWCDSQTGRSAGAATSIKLAHISDSYKKVRKADVVLSLNQLDEEVEEERCRISTIKVRRSRRSSREIHCLLRASCMTLEETDPPLDEDEMPRKRRISVAGRPSKKKSADDDRGSRRERDERSRTKDRDRGDRKERRSTGSSDSRDVRKRRVRD